MKKLITIILAMVMLFAITAFIVGCGNDTPPVVEKFNYYYGINYYLGRGE